MEKFIKWRIKIIKDFESNSFFCKANVEYELTNSQKLYAIIKRGFDFLVSLVALMLLLPLFLLLTLVIKLTSTGSIIFSQKRVGQYGQVIKIYKFRTMSSKAPNSKATSDFSDAPEYITKFGKFLRATSLDELPQLFNVLKGDMSIIGPRPLILDEILVHKLRKENDVYLIKPGITGLAQVNGRDFLNAEDKVNFDAQYLHNMSLYLDLKIFIKSIIVVFKRQGSLDAKR